MAKQRFVVFRPEPAQGWRVQQEIWRDQTGWEQDEEGMHQDFPSDGKFAEAHEWALAQHPGWEVFVPMGAYTPGMSYEEDVKAQERAGHAVEVAE